MEIFEENEVKEEKEGQKEGGKRRFLRKPSFKKPSFPSLPPVSNTVLIGTGGAVVLALLLLLVVGRKQTVVTSTDTEVITKLLEKQMESQMKVQQKILEKLSEMEKKIERSGVPRSFSGSVELADEGKRKDIFDLLKKKTRKKKEESRKEQELQQLRKQLEELRRSVTEERSKREEEIKIEVHEREVKAPLRPKGSVAKGRKKEPKKKVFIPAGSVMRGQIVSAFFAPVGGKRFPAVLIRLKGEVSLPNGYVFPVDECRVIAKAEGDWILERARLETYKMACVLPSGKVVETKFSGKVVSGLDGGEGVKGRFVNASAKQLRTYFATTFLGTLFEALAQSQVRSSIAVEGGAVFKSEIIKSEGEYALYSALADTWKNFSQFYLEQAKKALPVVLVDGGVPVYIEVVDGFSLGVSTDEVASLYK